jgi:hypothetical protein
MAESARTIVETSFKLSDNIAVKYGHGVKVSEART